MSSFLDDGAFDVRSQAASSIREHCSHIHQCTLQSSFLYIYRESLLLLLLIPLLFSSLPFETFSARRNSHTIFDARKGEWLAGNIHISACYRAFALTFWISIAGASSSDLFSSSSQTC